MLERRKFDPTDLDRAVDTSSVSIPQEVRDEVDEHIKTGRFVIDKGKVFYHDPKMGNFSARDTYEVNLDGGYMKIELPEGDASELVIAPVNFEPLAYLRQLANWEPSQDQ